MSKTQHDIADIINLLIRARKQIRLTQKQIGEKMKTSAIGRLESRGGKFKYSPTLRTLNIYAHAVGCEIKFELVKKARK